VAVAVAVAVAGVWGVGRVGVRYVDVVHVDFGGEAVGFDEARYLFGATGGSGDVVDGVGDGRGGAGGATAVHVGLR
jgi:hypothetical protein